MKKAISIFLGIGLVVGLFVVTGFAQQYHIVYSGADFKGYNTTNEYRGYNGGVYAIREWSALWCGVHFPDSANGMQVQRVSISVVDNDDSYLYVRLHKQDRWTGQIRQVAYLETEELPKSTSVQVVNIPKSQMNSYGIDNTRYAWYLFVVFYAPGSDEFRLNQVTIRYY